MAQDTGRWEVGAFAGGSFGSRIFLDPNTDIQIGKSSAFGLRGALSVDRSFSFELTLSRASPRLVAVSPSTGAPLAPSAAIDVNTYELNGLYGFGDGRLRGYMGLGVGAMTLHPFVPGVETEADTRFVANAALGWKLYLSDRLALRVDGRYRWRSASPSTGRVVCGSLGCYGFTTTSLYSSSEVTGGLSYRFGGPRIWETPAPPASQTSTAVLASPSRRRAPPERFFMAAGEVALVELLPWAYDRYVTKEDFAFISTQTVKENFRNGFGYDRDAFNMNQASHPFHGSLYFNAARSNGYSYWESGAFTLAGSFLWECCMENTQPSINDLVNTTFGGMSRGEMAHRLGVMLRDNKASGFTRFWRELASAIVDPMGGFNRLLRGEMTRQFANPDERFPSRFSVVSDLGYRHIGAGAADPNQGIISLSAVYGDAFAGEIRKPFDTFWLEADVSTTGVSRVEGRGVLKGWELGDPTGQVRHILGVFQEYEYFSNESQVFAAQIFSTGLLSRYSLGPNLKVSTDVTAIVFPLAAIKTTNFLNPETGRSYDFAPGGGFRLAARLYRKEWEIVRLGYGVAFARTADGSSSSNTLQFFRASGRLPLTRSLGVGAGYSWYSRRTTYSGFHEVPKTQSEWRVFASWSL